MGLRVDRAGDLGHYQFLPVTGGILAVVVALTRPELEALMMPGDLPSLPDLLPPRPAWMARAACRGWPTAMFFPTRGETPGPAREVCDACPVRVECGDYALSDPDVDGLWAGMTARERGALRRQAS